MFSGTGKLDVSDFYEQLESHRRRFKITWEHVTAAALGKGKMFQGEAWELIEHHVPDWIDMLGDDAMGQYIWNQIKEIMNKRYWKPDCANNCRRAFEEYTMLSKNGPDRIKDYCVLKQALLVKLRKAKRRVREKMGDVTPPMTSKQVAQSFFNGLSRQRVPGTRWWPMNWVKEKCKEKYSKLPVLCTWEELLPVLLAFDELEEEYRLEDQQRKAMENPKRGGGGGGRGNGHGNDVSDDFDSDDDFNHDSAYDDWHSSDQHDESGCRNKGQRKKRRQNRKQRNRERQPRDEQRRAGNFAMVQRPAELQAFTDSRVCWTCGAAHAKRECTAARPIQAQGENWCKQCFFKLVYTNALTTSAGERYACSSGLQGKSWASCLRCQLCCYCVKAGKC